MATLYRNDLEQKMIAADKSPASDEQELRKILHMVRAFIKTQRKHVIEQAAKDLVQVLVIDVEKRVHELLAPKEALAYCSDSGAFLVIAIDFEQNYFERILDFQSFYSCTTFFVLSATMCIKMRSNVKAFDQSGLLHAVRARRALREPFLGTLVTIGV